MDHSIIQLYRHSLAYTFGRLLNEALDDFKNRWNSHRIRPSRTGGCPSGVLDDLYSLPQLTGYVHQKILIFIAILYFPLTIMYN